MTDPTPRDERTEDGRYVPALGFHFLNRLYDPLAALLLRERHLRGALLEQIAPRPGQRILDVGCGTGTFVLMLKRSCPTAEIAGLDGDPGILEIARKKLREASLTVELHLGLAGELPFPDRSFDTITSSFVVHHLTSGDRERAFRDIHRVLKPGSSFHLMDFGPPQNAAMRIATLSFRLLDGLVRTRDNLAGRLPQMMEKAGFAVVEETHHEMTLFGSVVLHRAFRATAS